MSGLVDGKWVNGDVAVEEIKNGAFHREETKFRQTELVPEAGRYQLFVSYLCPWASRTLIFRKLKGLENVIPLSIAKPRIADNGWEFDAPQDAGEHVGEIHYLHQLYTASVPNYTGKVSVPVLWDRVEGRIVNNESADIIRMLNNEFNDLTGNYLDFYPSELHSEIDRWNETVYHNVNNGVYKTGFAKTQEHYNDAVTTLFATLDDLDARLSNHRYILGDTLTEADWRLFVTLIRFDVAYHGAFKCNLKRIADYPHLSNYLRELYQWSGIAETVNIDHIKAGYYGIAWLNPTQIVPVGPQVDLYQPHNRNTLGTSRISTR
ncbi:glutathione S-transferase family protein [Pectobacterium wasabiae]|uniref:Glutathionyl-hydroquinone reductase YqjG n=1 Tax=Pectobacterium wasabiae TaxID=55208 RepID=A0AAW3EHL3_9GAMM|nr:glutathione S-transferase family protein [Pectobacterium wasabiae]AOR62020.1 glutathione-dependent reductase [Pectobacterium wasabiae CFBP 3304]EJS95359.1 Glutathione S-transferase omega [Pectobacterium wasabiae CFBP 3304]KFX08304.1 glutathionyl-hydroquinone reductase YqjG [Pectobacterium wasabiae]KGA30939.1 glutathionyl-hydroquinone reductase YqjG [Pectobacterium wasabiae]